MLANLLFGDDVHLEGFVEDEWGVNIVISQPFVRGLHPRKGELADYVLSIGLQASDTEFNEWSFTMDAGPAGTLTVTDLHEDNVVISAASGKAVIINAHFHFGSRERRLKALRALKLYP